MFDTLRHIGYRQVLSFKRDGSQEDFQNHLSRAAEQTNLTFGAPLSPAELRSIVRSVVKWVWRRFSEHELSRVQAARRRGITIRNAAKLDKEFGKVAEANTAHIANALDRSDRTARRYKAREKQRHGVTPLSKSKPWEAECMSRATWYRKQRKNS